jgi:hypothetical protein
MSRDPVQPHILLGRDIIQEWYRHHCRVMNVKAGNLLNSYTNHFEHCFCSTRYTCSMQFFRSSLLVQML